jgi:hypothetical protein
MSRMASLSAVSRGMTFLPLGVIAGLVPAISLR